MKKAKQLHTTRQEKLTPEQTLKFLEDFRLMVHGQDKPTRLISLRVSENILESFKLKAKVRNQKYKSVIVQLMRQWAQEK